jgi:hypothetical protein
VRVLQSELDRFTAESSPAQIPTEETARRTFVEARDVVRATTAAVRKRRQFCEGLDGPRELVGARERLTIDLDATLITVHSEKD